MFGLVGHKPERNEYDSLIQPVNTITPSLGVQRSSPADAAAKQQMSSLPLVSYTQKLKDEPSMLSRKPPIKVDVSVKVVPKPKTKKHHDTHIPSSDTQCDWIIENNDLKKKKNENENHRQKQLKLTAFDKLNS